MSRTSSDPHEADTVSPAPAGTAPREVSPYSTPTGQYQPPRESASTAEYPKEGRATGFPRRFGRYELEAQIGQGGMGVVYRAWDPSLKRRVALKKIAPHAVPLLADGVRFRAEAQAAAQLDHRHIVTVLEVGETDGESYFTMLLVGNGTLAERRNAFRDRPAAAVELMAKVARAVGVAHEHGIIHRDLKPHNVLIDDAGEPRVSDFGLARVLAADAGWSDHGVRLGTPGYMPPEQARGDVAQACPASDVWSLGVMLYELLCGRRPFVGTSRESLTQQICEAEPAGLMEAAPELGADLDRIVRRCLGKDVGERYANATEVAIELERWLEQRQPRVSPVSIPRWKWALGGLAGVLSLGLLSMVFGPTPKPASLEAKELLAQFETGQPITLVEMTGGPRYSRFVTERDRPPIRVRKGAELTLATADTLLVELVPKLTKPYRFRAEVQHKHDSGGEVGIYFSHHEIHHSPAAGQWFWALTFADLGRDAGAKGLLAELIREYDASGKRLRVPLYRVEAPDKDARRGVWQELIVDMTGDTVLVSLGATFQREFGRKELATMARTNAPMRKEVKARFNIQLPDADQCPRVDGAGGIGLYVQRGEALYRNVTIEQRNSP